MYSNGEGRTEPRWTPRCDGNVLGASSEPCIDGILISTSQIDAGPSRVQKANGMVGLSNLSSIISPSFPRWSSWALWMNQHKSPSLYRQHCGERQSSQFEVRGLDTGKIFHARPWKARAVVEQEFSAVPQSNLFIAGGKVNRRLISTRDPEQIKSSSAMFLGASGHRGSHCCKVMQPKATAIVHHKDPPPPCSLPVGETAGRARD